MSELAAKIFNQIDDSIMIESDNLRKVSSCNSDNILKFVEMFEKDGNYILLTEYCERNLSNLVEEEGG